MRRQKFVPFGSMVPVEPLTALIVSTSNSLKRRYMRDDRTLTLKIAQGQNHYATLLGRNVIHRNGGSVDSVTGWAVVPALQIPVRPYASFRNGPWHAPEVYASPVSVRRGKQQSTSALSFPD